MRGRNNNNNNNNNNNRRSHNPLTRVYESNGPDVKIRGTANHVAEKYLQLARDAQSSGDPVSAENYFQHAEHYFRLIATAQEQFRQNNPNFTPRPEGGNDQQFQPRPEEFENEGEEDSQPFAEAAFGTREPQPYIPPNAQPFVQRDNQPYQPREDAQTQEVRHQPRPPQQEGGPTPCRPSSPARAATAGAEGENGGQRTASAHRRRRRHRPGDMQEDPQATTADDRRISEPGELAVSRRAAGRRRAPAQRGIGRDPRAVPGSRDRPVSSPTMCTPRTAPKIAPVRSEATARAGDRARLYRRRAPRPIRSA